MKNLLKTKFIVKYLNYFFFFFGNKLFIQKQKDYAGQI